MEGDDREQRRIERDFDDIVRVQEDGGRDDTGHWKIPNAWQDGAKMALNDSHDLRRASKRSESEEATKQRRNSITGPIRKTGLPDS